MTQNQLFEVFDLFDVRKIYLEDDFDLILKLENHIFLELFLFNSHDLYNIFYE